MYKRQYRYFSTKQVNYSKKVRKQPLSNLDVLRANGNNLYCIEVSQNTLSNIPPTCSDSIFENTNFSCFDAQLDVVNPDDILGYTADSFFDDPNSSPNITYPSTWVSDENVGYAIDCDTYKPCQISVSSIDGQLNQTVTVNNSISTINVNHQLSSNCNSPTYSLTVSGTIPGVNIDFNSSNSYF